MAAEKLTTGRLVQILVVMSVLITAFIWRTMNYSSNETALICQISVGACSVSLESHTVDIHILKQEDGEESLAVTSRVKPINLRVDSERGNNVILQQEIARDNSDTTYIYVLPESVKTGPNQKLILFIDQDQIAINF
ncbi:hypothetical protein [Enterovibrio norvegicus]|uniref:Uncharacterized protein n=1 Tax=Enterovibrio norvegicus TaxID=188144 RepID=A0A2N7L4G8_9GAMM|nr:hypothetical protein [Enterovibrio norvegicus]PMN88235.1 hypothetical protein BCT23_07375 [Enterovibrio norvegicus]